MTAGAEASRRTWMTSRDRRHRRGRAGNVVFSNEYVARMLALVFAVALLGKPLTDSACFPRASPAGFRGDYPAVLSGVAGGHVRRPRSDGSFLFVRETPVPLVPFR